jgi:hypothetical protein
MNQILFLFGLYSFGVFLGLLFKEKLPAALIGISGFLWGALLWVMGGMVLLTTTIPYTLFSMLAYFFLLGLVVGILHVRNKTWPLSRQELTSLLLFGIIFFLFLLLARSINFSTTSQDSIAQIATGRRLAYEGLSSWVVEELSLRGIFLSLLQSASVFLGEDYLYLLQPGFAFTFLLVFFYLTRRIISHLLSDQRLALVYALLASAAFFSTYFIVFQFFYVHNSLISAGYLFLAVASFWLGAQEENQCWMVPGMVALLGFSLARNEAPIFALIFLVLVISADRIPYQTRLRTILPYLSLVILWYVYLLARMGAGTKILNPEKTLFIIAALVACGALVLISKLEWVQRWLLPYLPQVMLGGLALMLAAMVIIKPGHMMISIWITMRNTLEVGGWGITWSLFGFLFVLSVAGPRVPWDKLFFYGIFSFLFLLMGIVFFRNPFRLGWGDSGNRMLTHILPIIVLYISMKAAQGSTLKEPTTSRRS